MKDLVLTGLLPLLLASPSWSQTYDIVIRNGRLIDGTGNPWYVADLGIREGRIAAIGRLDPGSAKRVIDAEGRVVAPGFIDIHTHVESDVRRRPSADNFLFDGVTSVITGNCGGSEIDLEKFFGEVGGTLSLNLGTLIGHNSVRREVMGAEQRDPTPEEQARMEALVEKAMSLGAVGLSTGLIYIPGTYSKTPEVVGLACAAAKHDGVYASHIRSEGTELFDAVAEAIQIGRECRMPVEISHFKVANKRLWGQSTRSLAMVEKARAEGLDVTVDQYPYTASATNLGVLLPSWALAGGQPQVLERLKDPAIRKKIIAETKDVTRRRAGRKRLDYAVVARCGWDSSLDGKSVSEITRLQGRKNNLEGDIETVLAMIEKGGAGMVYHSMDERDVERILRYPDTMIASDGGIQELGQGLPHPRSYGTNARVLARYVREKGSLRLEEAIRKMTSLPAQRFRLTDRGLLRTGLAADIVVFDPKTVADRATLARPHAYSEGLAYVLVNGEVVIEGGQHTGAHPGQILLGPGVRPKVADAP